MYFDLVCHTELFALGSGRKRTCKVFCQATEHMVLVDHELLENSTSPFFAFVFMPLHMRISLPLGRQLIGVFFATQVGAKNPSQDRAQTLTLCTCEHECKKLRIMLTTPIARGHFRVWS